MTCANCHHGPDDHLDRAFGYPRCAPALPTGESYSGRLSPRVKAFDCPGWAS